MIDVSVECTECGATLTCSVNYLQSEVKLVVERCTCEDEAIRDEGYNDGYDEGERDGYHEGYADGKVDGEQSVNSFINLVAKTKTGE